MKYNDLSIKKSPIGVIVEGYGLTILVPQTEFDSIDDFFNAYDAEIKKEIDRRRKLKMNILDKIQEYGLYVKIYNEELGRNG